MPPFRERFTSTVRFVLLGRTIGNSENYFGGGRGRCLPGRRISFEVHVPPLKTIRASPECTNQIPKRPSPSLLNVEFTGHICSNLVSLPSLIPHPSPNYIFAPGTSPPGTDARAGGRCGNSRKTIPARTSRVRIIESARCLPDGRNNETARSAPVMNKFTVAGKGGTGQE